MKRFDWRVCFGMVLAVPAFVAIWGGWVALGKMCGFGQVNLLPGFDTVSLNVNLAITLPIGMEVYGAFATAIWLSRRTPAAARRFAKYSAWASLAVGAGGQVAYHVMASWGWERAPWGVVVIVACLPVGVFGLAMGLTHLIREGEDAAPGSAEQGVEVLASPLEQARQVVDGHWMDLTDVWGWYDPWAEQEERVRAERRERAVAETAAQERIAQARTERDAEKAARISMWGRLAAVLTKAGEKPTEAELREWLELRLDAFGSVPSRDMVRAEFKPAPANPVIDRLRKEVEQAAQERAAAGVPETTSEGV